MKLVKIFLISILLFSNSLGQSDQDLASRVLGIPSHLYKMQEKLVNGNKNALFELAEYFDSKKEITEFLGYHRIETTESKTAVRIIQENCIFTPNEISITESTTKKEFLRFLKLNESKIIFSKEAEAFLVTPLESRKVDYEIIEISPNKKSELKSKSIDLLKLEWVKKEGIDDLINEKNPKALFKIASHLFRLRSKWNRYYFDDENDLALLQYFTGTQIVVKNEKDEFSYHLESDFRPDSKLNLLIFFAKNYKNYKFDNEKFIFVNPAISAKSPSNERILFEDLFNEDDTTAFNSFIKLTELDPNLVGKIADEYEKTNLDSNANSSLPTFPFRFLKQLSLLADYCRKNNVDYKGSNKIKSIIENLKKELTISERYSLENKIINELSLEEITAFEYWALIYETEWDLTYSAGRILDKAYAKHWNKLVADDKQLNLYIKKSKLFDNIGIVGAVNKYLDKFIAPPQNVVGRVKTLKTSDKDVTEQTAKILQLKPSFAYSENPKNEKFDVPQDLEKRLKEFAEIRLLEDKEKDELITILSKITYQQIGISIKYLEQINFKNPSKFDSKYEFLTDDWGFDLVGDFDDDAIRKEFVGNYSKMNQSELYEFYLDRNNFDFRKPDKSLDFDKIYEMLKYDIVEAFAGGGGGRREKHVYSLIILLENQFKTSQGFMNKLCVSQNTYACSSLDRAKSWMVFLKNNKHLKLEHNEPTSFTFRDD